MEKLRWPVFLVLLIGFSASGLFAFIAQDDYIRILEKHFSPDGHVSNPARVMFIIHYSFFGMILIWVFATSRSSLTSFSESRFADKLAYALIATLFVFHFSYSLTPKTSLFFRLYEEDHVLESLTAFCAIASSALFLLFCFRAQKWPTRLASLALAAFFLVFGMEEVSWGQRITGWSTPDSWRELNHQNETNVHNTIREIKIIYPVFDLCAGAVLGLLAATKSKLPQLVPHHEFRCYSLIFLALSVYGFGFSPLSGSGFFFRGELTEEVLSVFGLAYALFLTSRRHPELSP